MTSLCDDQESMQWLRHPCTLSSRFSQQGMEQLQATMALSATRPRPG